jgi:hypothetical protein
MLCPIGRDASTIEPPARSVHGRTLSGFATPKQHRRHAMMMAFPEL